MLEGSYTCDNSNDNMNVGDSGSSMSKVEEVGRQIVQEKEGERKNESTFLLEKDRASRKLLVASFMELVVKHKMFLLNFIKRLIGHELRKRGYSDISIEEKPDG